MNFSHSQLFVIFITLIYLNIQICKANHFNNNKNIDNNSSNKINTENTNVAKKRANNERYSQDLHSNKLPLNLTYDDNLMNQKQQKIAVKLINKLKKHQKRSELSQSATKSIENDLISSIASNSSLGSKLNDTSSSVDVLLSQSGSTTLTTQATPIAKITKDDKQKSTSSSLSSVSSSSVSSSSDANNEQNNLSTGNSSCLNASDTDCEEMNVTGVYCDSEDDIPCNITKEEYMEFLYAYLYPKTAEWILFILHAIVFITGLVGNALVCIAVYTNYSMRTVTNIYIVNLAIADFLVILVCLPPTVAWDILETWFLGKTMCKIVTYCQSISVTVSVLTLTFISVDRWYAICFPLRYRTKISRAISSVAFIWILALISHIPELLALTLREMKLRYKTILFTQCSTTWDKDTEKDFYLARFVLLYLLPLLLMMVAYFKIVRVLWKSDTIPGHRESRNHHQYSCSYARGSCMTTANTSTMGQLQARRKAAKMLVSVVIMFAVCYFPVHLFNILRYTDTDVLQYGEVTNVISLFSHWLMYANSAVNPVIYNFMSGKFRKEFRNALEKCRCARVRVEDRCLNHSNPPSRLNNISPSTRSNYQLTSVRDITRDFPSRQSMQTNFIENYGNGHTTTSASSQKLNQTNTDRSL